MERNECLKAADKCASKYTNENEARIARESFMLGCEFEAQGEIVKGVVLETEDKHWKPSVEQLEALEKVLHRCPETLDTDKAKVLWGLFDQLKKLK